MSEEDIKIKETEETLNKEDFKFKILIIGDSGVGKTNLLKRFKFDSFNEEIKSTIGVEFFCSSYYINNKLCKVELWDTAGQERYKAITKTYYKGANGALLVYDMTNKPSFENIDNWYREIKENSSPNITFLLVGNKCDLKDNVVISKEESVSKAERLGMPIMETSAFDATNVKEAFYLLLKEIFKNFKDTGTSNVKSEGIGGGDSITTLEKKGEPEKKKGCC